MYFQEETNQKENLTFVVDLPIAINVRLADHFVHLLVSELLPQVGHDVP